MGHVLGVGYDQNYIVWMNTEILWFGFGLVDSEYGLKRISEVVSEYIGI